MSKRDQFKKLHDRSKIFVLPNAWDPISARTFESSGFKAIGTTSAGNASSRFHETIERAWAYEKVGAHCVFIPGLSDPSIIRKLRKRISIPINLLVDSEMPSVDELSTMNIERLSCGSAPFRATTTLLKKISEELLNEQTYHHMTDDVLSYDDIKKYTD